MTRYLISGSTGMIGAGIVDFLLSKGKEVYGVDNLSLSSLSDLSPQAVETFTKLDLMDKKATKDYIEKVKPDVIFHCAAWAHESLGQFCPTLITENSINTFLNLIVPAINNGLKHIVLFSSMAVYGHQEPPFAEDMPKKPADVYAACKAYLEDTTIALSNVHSFTYTILRPYNIYGERQSLTDPYRGVVALFANKIMKGEPLTVYGDGEQERMFSYLGDIVPCIVDCATNPKAVNEIFNIGDGRVRTINDLIRAFEEVSEGKLELTHLEDRAVEVKLAYCDNSKIKNTLGLEVKTPFNEAIKKTWEYMKKLGPQKLRYLDDYELSGPKMPKNWKTNEKRTNT